MAFVELHEMWYGEMTSPIHEHEREEWHEAQETMSETERALLDTDTH